MPRNIISYSSISEQHQRNETLCACGGWEGRGWVEYNYVCVSRVVLKKNKLYRWTACPALNKCLNWSNVIMNWGCFQLNILVVDDCSRFCVYKKRKEGQNVFVFEDCIWKYVWLKAEKSWFFGVLSAECDVLCAFFTIGSELIPHFRSRAHKSAEITVSITKNNNHTFCFQ